MSAAPDEVEFTIDELAHRAGMTVRNVRAYSGRGLIDPPRLVGRTGYYTVAHLQRLQLIRSLLGRGFTLAAVEAALLTSPETAPGHALELLHLVAPFEPTDDTGRASEIITRTELAALANVPADDVLMNHLDELGLTESIDYEHFKVANPPLVRLGAAARALGLTSQSVIEIVPLMRDLLQQLSDAFVSRVSKDLISPFLDAGLPEDEWEAVFSSVQSLIPIGAQVVLAAFREQLNETIEDEIGRVLAELGGHQSPHPDVSGS